MSGNRPERVLDPVCGMSVDVAQAEAAGLTLQHSDRTYAFCRPGCVRAFQEEPEVYAAEHAQAITVPRPGSLPMIDEGIRRWYESCSCCLSDAYPEIKAALDAERAVSVQTPVAAGICEIAESVEVPAP
jgi:YHS domain-containing protein